MLLCFALIYPLNLGWSPVKTPSVDTAVWQRRGGEPGPSLSCWLFRPTEGAESGGAPKVKKKKSLMRTASCPCESTQLIQQTKPPSCLRCQGSARGHETEQGSEMIFFGAEGGRDLWRGHIFFFCEWQKKINSCAFLFCFSACLEMVVSVSVSPLSSAGCWFSGRSSRGRGLAMRGLLHHFLSESGGRWYLRDGDFLPPWSHKSVATVFESVKESQSFSALIKMLEIRSQPH